jgi:geranylgeranyl transferase type-1 subunit beta
MMAEYPKHHTMKRMVSPFSSIMVLSLTVIAGYTYCAIGALSFLDRLPQSTDSLPGLTNIPSTIKWLVSRQVGYSTEESESPPSTPINFSGISNENAVQPSGISGDNHEFVGFNGRCNKMVDTCYSFWVTGSLDVCL